MNLKFVKTKVTVITIGLMTLILGLSLFGYLNSVPPPEENSARPQIEITPNTFDFGEIEFGDIVETVFSVKNIGSKVLVIKRLATSCGCTSADMSVKELAPGETVDLLVVYDSGAMSGPHGMGDQERIIYIKSNDPLTPHVEVTTHAYVK